VVEEAWLAPWTSSHLTVALAGSFQGDASTLTIVDDGDQAWEVPVQLTGLLLGVGVNVGFTLTESADLTLPNHEITARELVGGYSGPFFAFEAGIGGSFLEVENLAGAGIQCSDLSVGVGMSLTEALLMLDVQGEAEMVEISESEPQ
jgi:hypothetical protein